MQSTPTLYVNGRPVVGAQPFEFFQAVIDEELRGAADKYGQGLQASRDQHDLALGAGLENELVRPCRVRQRQLHDTSGRACRLPGRRRARDRSRATSVGVVFHSAIPTMAPSFAHRLARIDFDAAAIADDDDASAKGQRREIVVEIHVGEVLENDVGAAAAGQILERVEIAGSRDD